MSFAFRLLPRVPLLLCLSLAILTARRRLEARPVAWALAGMACLDVARLAPLPPRLDVWAWIMWPAVSAALSWCVWQSSGGACANGSGPIDGRVHGRQNAADDDAAAPGAPSWHVDPERVGETHDVLPPRSEQVAFRDGLHAHGVARPWALVLLAFAAYATALVLVPRGWWPAHAWAWPWASHAPYVAGPAASMLAWALRKDEGLDVGVTSSPSLRVGGTEPHSSTAPTGAPAPGRFQRAATSTLSASLSQAVAAVFAWSSFLDVAVGALASGAPWWLAWATSAATYAVAGAMLVRWRIRSSN